MVTQTQAGPRARPPFLLCRRGFVLALSLAIFAAAGVTMSYKLCRAQAFGLPFQFGLAGCVIAAPLPPPFIVNGRAII